MSSTIIQKSPEDNREYRYITLENGLRALLIHDAQTDKAAAAMNVAVGSFHDPDDIPGLAHFCEHMSFMGSAKYPEESEYNEFIEKHGGYTNAFTEDENTNYHLQVNTEHLEPALDRLAQFFVAPLFTQSCTDRELNAVHSEHQKNVQNDYWRVNQVQRSASNPQHPLHRFSTGSLETLRDGPLRKGIDIRTALLEWYDKYYSADIMTLCILGVEPLDELEQMVRLKFAAVPNKRLSLPNWNHVPVFTPEQTGKIYRIIPVKDIKEVTLLFYMDYSRDSYTTKQAFILSHLLGHEGRGTIYWHLAQELGWATAVHVSSSQIFAGKCNLSVNVELTEEGEQHFLEIVRVIFQYLEMLRVEGIPQWFLEEYAQLQEINFRYAEKIDAVDACSRLSQNLVQYAPEHVLSGDFLVFQSLDSIAQRITQALEQLRPQNSVVLFVSDSFASSSADELDQEPGGSDEENEPGCCDADCCLEGTQLCDPYYGTQYSVQDVDPDMLLSLRQLERNEALRLPERNEFIPTRFEVKKPTCCCDCASSWQSKSVPTAIRDSSRIKAFHLLDEKFQQPKLNAFFRLTCPAQYLGPDTVVMSKLFDLLLQDLLNDTVYYAELAGLNLQVMNSGIEGIILVFAGYHDKLSKLIRRVFETIVMDPQQIFSPERFMIMKEQLHRDYANVFFDDIYELSFTYTDRVLNRYMYQVEDLIKALECVQFEHFVQFVRGGLLQSIQVDCLLHGNITREEAIQQVDELETILFEGEQKRFGLLPSQIPVNQMLKLDEFTDYRMQKLNPNEDDSNSSVEIRYQIGHRDLRRDQVLNLFCKIVGTPYFEQLRSVEQLGYVVFSIPQVTSEVSFLVLLIQSHERDSHYCLSRSDDFMTSFRRLIAEELSDEDIQEYVDEIIKEKTEPDTALSKESSRHWSEINNRKLLFDRRDKQIECLRTLSRADLLEFFDAYIDTKSTQCRRFITELYAHSHEGAMNCEQGSHEGRKTVWVGADLAAFKNSMPLYNQAPPEQLEQSQEPGFQCIINEMSEEL